MKKLDVPKFDYNEYNFDELVSTKYDYLFRDIIKARGVGYYRFNEIRNFKKEDNKISAIVKGTKDYNVSVTFIDEVNIDVSCECEYHKSTDKYCKHVYSLLLKLKLIYEKEKMLEKYKDNIVKIYEVMEMIKSIVNDNKKYLESIYINTFLRVNDNYLDYLKRLEYYEKSKDIKEFYYAFTQSFKYLSGISTEYNEIVDEIEKEKKRYEELERKRQEDRIKEQEEMEDEEEEEEEGVLEYSAEADKIIDRLDNILASLPIDVLEEYKKNNLEDGNDVSMFDKAIEEKKRREQELYRQKAKWRKRARRVALFSFLAGVFEGLKDFHGNSSTYFDDSTDYLMPWEKDQVDSGEYEPYQFEEEDMDEDDYYYEDK